MELGKCLSCKTVFSFKPSQQAGKYCCNACQHEYQQKQLFAKIRTLGKKTERCWHSTYEKFSDSYKRTQVQIV